MKKTIITFVIGAILGAAGGFAAGIFFYPFIFLADIVAEEQVPQVQVRSRKVIASGTFIHAKPSDPIHYGKGGVTVYQDLVHLESDFEVGPGPKFHVYLVPEANITPMTSVEKTMFVDLGRLKAFKGSQNYPVPEGVDLSQYASVVIWCEHFAVLISPATLQFR